MSNNINNLKYFQMMIGQSSKVFKNRKRCWKRVCKLICRVVFVLRGEDLCRIDNVSLRASWTTPLRAHFLNYRTGKGLYAWPFLFDWHYRYYSLFAMLNGKRILGIPVLKFNPVSGVGLIRAVSANDKEGRKRRGRRSVFRHQVCSRSMWVTLIFSSLCFHDESRAAICHSEYQVSCLSNMFWFQYCDVWFFKSSFASWFNWFTSPVHWLDIILA